MSNKSKPIKVRFNGMEKEIQDFADKNCEGNYNQAVRMLCRTSLTNRQEKTMSDKNEHYFEALDNDGDREVDDSQDFIFETRQQMINRQMKARLNEGKDNGS